MFDVLFDMAGVVCRMLFAAGSVPVAELPVAGLAPTAAGLPAVDGELLLWAKAVTDASKAAAATRPKVLDMGWAFQTRSST